MIFVHYVKSEKTILVATPIPFCGDRFHDNISFFKH